MIYQKRHLRKIAGELVFLKFRKNNLKNTRCGFVINLKTSKKSTIRNKIKRRLREIIRQNLINIKPGFDIVVIAKPEIVNKNYQEIKKEIESLFKKTKVYK